jgi:hypothetical protein
LIFAPELGVALLENCPSKPREQQLWMLALSSATGDKAGDEKNRSVRPTGASSLAPRSSPHLVEDAVVSVLSSTRVELTWRASGDKDVIGYQVERAPVEVFSEDQLVRLKKQTPPLAEPSVGAFRRVGPFARLTIAPVQATAFTDTTVDLAKPASVLGEPVYERKFNREQFDESGRPYRLAVFAYRIRAVNAAGKESGPSPAFFTLPSAPQWLFSKEDGSTCHLKWAANAEKALRGYRVYRMNGRYDKDPIPRLTADPIAATNFSDATAGKSSRRYYVVAVDALGQEGFPSAPVWFEREWKQYYKPFIGEWHQ